ncbi:MAG: hypothetical protein Q7J54_08100 [Candidatus Woesearchaeota archaeon]|nr:hypothetical protein [Candidatus Woesearchaeota archaeon]
MKKFMFATLVVFGVLSLILAINPFNLIVSIAQIFNFNVILIPMYIIPIVNVLFVLNSFSYVYLISNGRNNHKKKSTFSIKKMIDSAVNFLFEEEE